MQVENRSARLLNVTATPFLLPMNPYHTKALSLWFTRAPERYPNPLCNPHETAGNHSWDLRNPGVSYSRAASFKIIPSKFDIKALGDSSPSPTQCRNQAHSASEAGPASEPGMDQVTLSKAMLRPQQGAHQQHRKISHYHKLCPPTVLPQMKEREIVPYLIYCEGDKEGPEQLCNP